MKEKMKIKKEIIQLNVEINKIKQKREEILNWVYLQIKVKENKLALPKYYITIIEANKEKIISIKRISKTVKGGRHIRFNALVVVGNLKGNYGFAIKKSNEVLDAIKKASKSAKNNICKVYISKGETIAHEVIGKYGSTKVYLKSAPIGTGIIAGGPVRAILELIGFKNIVSKVYGSRTSINVIRATHNAICILNNIYNVSKLRNNKLHKN